MENSTVFYPMSTIPMPDESDQTFSKTVLIYGDKSDFVELGYYDFEVSQWSHFGSNIFLLKCWCYLPDPGMIANSEWPVIIPMDYSEFINGPVK